MSDSHSDSHANSFQNSQPASPPEIPIEIVSEEEMALIESAFAAATSSCLASSSICSVPSMSRSILFSAQLQSKSRSIQSITHLSKRRINGSSDPDVEDLGNLRSAQKRKKLPDSFLHRFRRHRGLAVTDLTSTEWCEKKMEFKLLFRSSPVTDAMKAGWDRHLKLEEEVVKKVKVRCESVEDRWVIKFVNSIICANQLLLEGLTRELPLIGVVDGVWMVGFIDEVQMLGEKTDRQSMLLETKTRVRETLPSEAQTRNGMFQLMCYKYLWDNLAANSFPSKEFLEFFSLNPHYKLPQEIRETTVTHGFPAETLEDIVRQYKNTCTMLPPAQEQLSLRYESQKDRSVIGEVKFAYDYDWVKEQIQACLEFWLDKRDANVVPEEERWKCQCCQFASVCPVNPNPDGKVDSMSSIDHLILQASEN